MFKLLISVSISVIVSVTAMLKLLISVSISVIGCFGHSNVKVVDQRVYFGDWLFRSQQCLSC